MLVPVPIQVANMSGCELHCNPTTILTSHFTWAQCSAVNKAPSRNILCNSSSVSQASFTSLKEKFMLKLSFPKLLIYTIAAHKVILKANCTQNTYYCHLVKSYTVSKQVVVTASSEVCGTTSYHCLHLFF